MRRRFASGVCGELRFGRYGGDDTGLGDLSGARKLVTLLTVQLFVNASLHAMQQCVAPGQRCRASAAAISLCAAASFPPTLLSTAMSKPSVMSTRSWRRFIATLITFSRVRMVRSRVHLLEPWHPATAALPSASVDPRKHLFSLDGIVRSTEHDTVRACWMAPAASADSRATTFGRQMTCRGMERDPGQPLT